MEARYRAHANVGTKHPRVRYQIAIIALPKVPIIQSMARLVISLLVVMDFEEL